MPSSLTSTVVGWTISLVLYFIILMVGAYALQSNQTKIIKYTAHKKTLLNVTLVERKKHQVEKKRKKKVVKKKTTVQKPKSAPKKRVVRVKKVESKPNFKKLFGKIDLKELPEQTQKREQKTRKRVVKKDVEEVLKDEKAKKITKSLEFDQQKSIISTQRDGIYDEFKGKISDILDSHWQETIDTVSGNVAKVIISVDKFGSFSYKIETLSYNDTFNAKLRNFLEEMSEEKFPAYKDGEIFRMKVDFKDILE